MMCGLTKTGLNRKRNDMHYSHYSHYSHHTHHSISSFISTTPHCMSGLIRFIARAVGRRR